MNPELPQPNPYMQYQQPQSPRAPRSKAWLWVLIVIMLLAGTAAGVYFWQQGQVDAARRERDQAVQQAQQETGATAESVEFTAQNLPFTFKRLSDWTVQTQAGVTVDQATLGESYGISLYAPGTVEVGGAIGGTEITNGATIIIAVNKKPTYKSVAEYTGEGFTATSKNKIDVTVAGQPGIEYEYSWEGPKRVYTHFFKDGTQYTIYYEPKMGEELKSGDNYKVYQELVKSFTFK